MFTIWVAGSFRSLLYNSLVPVPDPFYPVVERVAVELSVALPHCARKYAMAFSSFVLMTLQRGQQKLPRPGPRQVPGPRLDPGSR